MWSGFSWENSKFSQHPMDSRGTPKEAANGITVPRATPQDVQKKRKKRLRESP